MTGHEIITFSSIAVCFLPAIAGIACYRRLDKPAKILAIYFVILAIVSTFLFYLSQHRINNIRFYHFYDLVEYGFLVFAFSYWTGNTKLTRILRYSIFVFWAFSLANSLRMPDINHYSYLALALAYLVYVYISSLAIYNLIKEDTGKIAANPVFWLALSLFVMSTNNELWYAINGYLPYDRLYITLIDIHNIFNIMSAILSMIGILLYRNFTEAEKTSEARVYWN